MDASTNRWLKTLGYDGSVGAIYRASQEVRADHPYAREIDLLLRQNGEIRSSAVFEVDQVPAVCFIEPTSHQLLNPNFISEVRRKIWNQNLVSILVVIRGDQAIPYPAPRMLPAAAPLSIEEASPEGPFSATEVADGTVFERLPSWFDRKLRVDRVMQDNLSVAIELLGKLHLSIEQSQLLLGKCIFVSYLEDREIIGQRYRDSRKTKRLLELLEAADGKSLGRYFRKLKDDFNGDLLEIEGGANVDWAALDAKVFNLLKEFLLQTRLRDGQSSLWPYDFKYIPVELLSGIYETFLSNSQRDEGAVYTPRHLASLAVDEAFRGINEPWKEVVLDGACGSGILLTTAYRRMLGAKRAIQTRALTYEQRQNILLNHIRGGDVSAAATKVTAFSLYLALLEDLTPSDIALLQEDRDVKMPPLLGTVLAKDKVSDFFDPRNPIAKPGSATIVISNPPWYEPKGENVPKRYETWWADRISKKLPLRQIALAFARRATDALAPGGRLCLILPSISLGSANAGLYLKDWFGELAPERIFNFADMRFVLFDGAIHPTAVVVGSRRLDNEVGRIPTRETFEYLVPKADISLAFGRLTVHSFDRKQLLTHAAVDDAELLRTYFWGTELDESLIARLRMNGTFADHAAGKQGRFVICKGFHVTDKSKKPISPEPLKMYKFLSTARGASRFPKDRPIVRSKDLQPFPDHYTTVADYGSKDGLAFEGVRVIFPDGADSTTLEVRACYTDIPFCFTQTVGAIIDRESDRDLMQFAAVYLRSKLARYILFYTAFSMTMERPHVKLGEIEKLPFLLPIDHPKPEVAGRIIGEVCGHLQQLSSRKSGVSEEDSWLVMRDQLDTLVYDYFGLTATERQVVSDTCDFLIPSMQPSTLSALHQPLQKSPSDVEFNSYVRLLGSELELWRKRLKGEGKFHVQLSLPTSRKLSAMGVIRIGIGDKPIAKSGTTPLVIKQILEELRGKSDFPCVGDGVLSVASDFLLFHDGNYYFVKPMARRLWLASAAAHDAYRIVQTVRNSSAAN